MTKLYIIFSYIFGFILYLVQADVSGLLQAVFYIPTSTVPYLHVTCLTQFRDYGHEGHMLGCPAPHLHLSISSSVTDAWIFLTNNLFCSFSLACASCDLDARYCLFPSQFFTLFFASFCSSITLTCFLGLPLLVVSSIHPFHVILLLKSTNRNK
jgi:hypothetical protein